MDLGLLAGKEKPIEYTEPEGHVSASMDWSMTAQTADDHSKVT